MKLDLTEDELALVVTALNHHIDETETFDNRMEDFKALYKKLATEYNGLVSCRFNVHEFERGT